MDRLVTNYNSHRKFLLIKERDLDGVISGAFRETFRREYIVAKAAEHARPVALEFGRDSRPAFSARWRIARSTLQQRSPRGCGSSTAIRLARQDWSARRSDYASAGWCR
jgi:hypothetical protein